MNVLEKLTYNIGRTAGSYRKGLADVFHTSGARPSALDPTIWGDSVFWGEGVESGKVRTKEDMLREFTSWVYICASLNAESIGAAKLRLYVAKPESGKKIQLFPTRSIDKAQMKWLESNTGLDSYLKKAQEVEEVDEHPFLDLTKTANPFMSGREFRELTSLFLDLTGDAYWYIIRDGLQVPRELWVIPSPYIQPIPGKDLRDFVKGYLYKRGGIELTLEIDDVVHLRYPNPKNEYIGFSCVQGVADAVYVNKEMYVFEEALFKNKARVGGVLESTELIGTEEMKRLKEDWQQKYEGSAKGGKTAVLPPGMKFSKDTMTPQELSFIEGKKITREEIAVAFDIPIGKLVSTDVNRANADSSDYTHAKSGIMPRLRKQEEKLNELLSLFDTNIFCAFDDVVPEDREQLLKENTEYVNAGILSRDEVRADLGKEPKDADELLVDNRLVPISMLGAVSPEEQAEEVVELARQKIRERLG